MKVICNFKAHSHFFLIVSNKMIMIFFTTIKPNIVLNKNFYRIGQDKRKIAN